MGDRGGEKHKARILVRDNDEIKGRVKMNQARHQGKFFAAKKRRKFRQNRPRDRDADSKGYDSNG